MIYPEKQNLKQIAALATLVFIGAFLVYTLKGFLTAFLGAIILYVLFKPVMQILCGKWNWNKNLAVVVLILVSFVTVLLPISAMSYMLSSKINYALNHSAELLTGLTNFDAYIKSRTGFEILSGDSLTRIKEGAANLIPGFLGKTLDTLGTMGILYFLLFFMLKHYGIVEEKIGEYLPFSDANAQAFISELESMVFSSVLGAPLLAIIQGLFAWFGFFIFGLPEPLFWGIMCGFFSFVPIVGTTLIWLPASIYQISTGMHWQGAALFVYGAVIIGGVDNIFRFVLQKKIADVHPIITLLGVIMGIELLGLPGIVFGPLFISWFLLLVKIYKNEFSDTPKIVISSPAQNVRTAAEEIIKTDLTKE